jgi:prepilin-type N-terminal cleavage/methylation domain-containing protein
MIIRRRPGLPRELGAERFVDEAGFTLSEMLVVIAILGIVLAGLTQLFVSASKSQTDQTKRVGAQQDGRLALDKLRRELHCASAITLTSASSLTATLGTYCPSVPSTTLSSAVTLPAATISVASTLKFNTGSNTLSFGSSGTVTCTGKTSTSFIGCSGGTAGTYASGTKVISSVTWCVTGASAPFALMRYVGLACSGSSGQSWAASLISASIFSRSVVPAPTLTPGGTGGTLAAGTYAYEVAAVTASGEAVGTVAHVTISSGTTNKVTLSWSAYTGATSYNVYGRDDVSSGVRLLGNTTSTSYVDVGPTSLSSNLTVPASGTYTVPVVSTTGYFSGANTIAIGGSGNVACTGTTATTFTGCSGGIAGSYASGTVVNSVSATRPPLASLNVSLVLDKSPADTGQRFTVNDVIEFRNSRPF